MTSKVLELQRLPEINKISLGFFEVCIFTDGCQLCTCSCTENTVMDN